jgi:UDP-glucose 4-epimerase
MESKKPLQGRRVLITGGTGSLGQVLVRRILTGELGEAGKVTVFSRDEAKQHYMRMAYQHKAVATDEIVYRNFQRQLQFRIGDVRDFHAVASAVQDADVIFNGAALKQVPTCEYFPYEAVRTNIGGPENIVRAVQQHGRHVETVVGISTDKACKPVNAMGMTKALQERVFVEANLRCPHTRFVLARYGNVLASRGSVIPLFHDQIRHGGPLTITTAEMTRFLMSLDQAVDTVFAALTQANPGETFIPRVPSALVRNIATSLIAGRPIKTVITGIRPGEKVHEILVSEEEANRTILLDDRWYVILPLLPELRTHRPEPEGLKREYSSAHDLMTLEQTTELLRRQRMMVEDGVLEAEELVR